ncbi:MAG: hemolysin III family protein [Lentimicrobiaceae bacterium]|jgi:hemolysin III|nr:hemolysin III family protein [Lentimicrobiaceae bacterium]MCP4910821.1 hemolysin III family protein [Bacteroidota bacterium]MBT3454538.1 hemolysin III family protein [Lentimicrobiaceae bacterium]MBT3818132.1 hemolysin III family protein [Lentimicrobiaceae bacterium]MBT4061449.1 hemolysin III family protein [Lentimicrobiaceae bacterium]
MQHNAKQYPKLEERLNVVTHGLGFLLSIVALVILVVFASLQGTPWHMVSFSIYGVSLVTLYLASTLFHSTKKQSLRNKLNIFDHIAIYFLIAGTYTPFLLVTLRGPWGWSLFGIIWGLAIGGLVFKLFYTGKYDFISALIYLSMGWLIIIALEPLNNNLEFEGILWLLGGGFSYSIGVVFYLLNRLPYNHAIFHIWVLIGSFAHFIAVYRYVLPW